MSSVEKHGRSVPGGQGYWYTKRLWELSKDLPVFRLPIDEIAEFDQDCWFGGRGPSCRAVAEHARRINEADLSYPVIIAADGGLMDGGHRIAKAWLSGETSVAARRFLATPPPDWIEPN